MKKTILFASLQAALFIAPASFAAAEVHYDACKNTFDYLGVSYFGTTDKNNSGSQWCYLKQTTDGQTWANVRTESIPVFKTVSGKTCLTPSQYQGEAFYGCSTKAHSAPWCYVGAGDWEACAITEPDPEPLPVHTQLLENKTLQRIMVGSCFKTQGDMPAAMSRVIAQQPDLFLWLGDNIYGDTTDMNVMRQKYDDKKRNAEYQQFLAANIAVMATWDDHDFGRNNDGKHYPKRAESQLEFLRHFDVSPDDPRFHGQQGIYSSKMTGQTGEKTHVITLDARYFRSPTFSSYGSCEGDASTMLGEVQWQWLEAELNKPSEIKIIASGIQVLPPLHLGRSKTSYCAYGNGKNFDQAVTNLNENGMSGTSYESWAEMPLERERLLRMVQKSINDGKAKAVIFVSGDQHWGELLQKDIPASSEYGKAATVYEITASGFGQNWPYHIENPLRLPIYADNQGDGQYQLQCQLPFNYAGVTYQGCISRDHDKPWCYTELDSKGNGVKGQWGNCAPSGATIPTGKVGVVSEQMSALTTGNRHLINKSGSNYGMLDIDWTKRTIKMSIETADEEAVSTIINF
ncbi:alkaline phosphatase D family protein [Pseudoalteromonas fenneropenaei]|uniref:Alkaline phosphatase D family protein n=1 Tax=Pseudoalteromonas fenneropenaei TaxID=1737459 RepID=A0ABV7CGL1_9GAMM